MKRRCLSGIWDAPRKAHSCNFVSIRGSSKTGVIARNWRALRRPRIHHRRVKTTLLLLLATVALCLPVQPLRAAENAAPAGPDGIDWVVREINGKLAAPSGERGLPTLRLDAGKKQASGFSGVNRFFGGYERTGENLKFGALASTRMGGPPEQMAAERSFLKALEGVTEWRIEKGELGLLADGKVVVRFSVGAPAK